ncbi:MAG: DnaJ domain-containing protein [Paludibacteraceae bacterium]|nr:DnaJ domain-containing protein [Paludibacteraceae bacterium]
MKIEEIVRQKKWIDIANVLLSLLIYGFVIINMLCARLGVFRGSSWHSLLEALSVILMFFASFLTSVLSDSLYARFEKKWGMTKDQIASYVSRRADLGKCLNQYFPFIRAVCKLNEDLKEEQMRFLSEWFSEDELKNHVFQKKESGSKLKKAIEIMRKRPIGERRRLMEILFKLSVVEVGILDDEWNLLMDIMAQLNFNKYYLEYFKNRYSSLRAGFYEYEEDEDEDKSENDSKNERFTSYYGGLKIYYEILGLEENCSVEEIKRAYHSLALQHHPDLPKNAGRIEESEEMMTKINEAYEKLMRRRN